MAETQLMKVQHLIDRLTPIDQVRLMEYLSLRIEKVISSITNPSNVKTVPQNDAWTDFFTIGNELMQSDVPKSSTLTSTLLSMRR